MSVNSYSNSSCLIFIGIDGKFFVLSTNSDQISQSVNLTIDLFAEKNQAIYCLELWYFTMQPGLITITFLSERETNHSEHMIAINATYES